MRPEMPTWSCSAPATASGLSRLLVGSVSTEVVQHSACPVVIVAHQK